MAVAILAIKFCKPIHRTVAYINSTGFALPLRVEACDIWQGSILYKQSTSSVDQAGGQRDNFRLSRADSALLPKSDSQLAVSSASAILGYVVIPSVLPSL